MPDRRTSLQNEALDILEDAAPPSAKGGTWLPSDYVRFFAWFVQERVLSGWVGKFCLPRKGSDWPKLISQTELVGDTLRLPDHADVLRPRGNAADLWYIAMAKAWKLELITSEGFTPDAYGVGKISRRAAGEGVRTRFPKDVYAGKLNENYVANAFLERFAREAPRYLAERERERGPDRSSEFLEYLGGYCRHILFGDVEGSDTPVAVRINT